MIPQWRIQDFPLGGGGGTNLQRVHFSAKTYAKTKEMDPVGGACASGAPLDPPMYPFYKRTECHHRKVLLHSFICLQLSHTEDIVLISSIDLYCRFNGHG